MLLRLSGCPPASHPKRAELQYLVFCTRHRTSFVGGQGPCSGNQIPDQLSSTWDRFARREQSIRSLSRSASRRKRNVLPMQAAIGYSGFLSAEDSMESSVEPVKSYSQYDPKNIDSPPVLMRLDSVSPHPPGRQAPRTAAFQAVGCQQGLPQS